MTLQAAAYLAQVLAAVFAIVLARKHAPHRPAAVALVTLAASGILHGFVAAALLPIPRPVHGGRPARRDGLTTPRRGSPVRDRPSATHGPIVGGVCLLRAASTGKGGAA